MTYIRVVDHETKLKVDLNTDHIVAFAPADDSGTLISLVNGVSYHVSDTPRSVRGYVRKAQGLGTEVTHTINQLID